MQNIQTQEKCLDSKQPAFIIDVPTAFTTACHMSLAAWQVSQRTRETARVLHALKAFETEWDSLCIRKYAIIREPHHAG